MTERKNINIPFISIWRLFSFLSIFSAYSILCFSALIALYFGSVSINDILISVSQPLKGLPLFFQTVEIIILCIGFVLIFCLTYFMERFIHFKKIRIQVLILFTFCFSFIGLSCFIFPYHKFLFHLFKFPPVYEKEYVQVSSLKGNPKPENIVIVFLESMENSFSDEQIFGRNLIPNLSAIQKESLSFPNYLSLVGTSNTISAQVAFFCGIPLDYFFAHDSRSNFYPKLKCFPELLQKQGYHTVWFQGGDLTYVGTNIFLQSHGFSDITGKKELLKQNKITESDSGTKWGINDKKVFELAKEQLTELIKMTIPFLYVVVTLDTHAPNGYVSKNCSFNEDIYGAVECADKNVSEFVHWFQNQPFYDNTRLILIGDHPQMKSELTKKMHSLKFPFQKRTVYTAFLKKGQDNFQIDKKWSMPDMAPTILEWLGYNLPQHSFGLGRSIFSDVPSLSKRYYTPNNRFKNLGVQHFFEWLRKLIKK